MDCYRLAKFYGRDPDDFLKKPVSTVARHMRRTDELLELLELEKNEGT